MSGFGDYEPDDSFDPSDPDPQAVVRIFLALLVHLADDPERIHRGEDLLTAVFRVLLARLAREGGT